MFVSHFFAGSFVVVVLDWFFLIWETKVVAGLLIDRWLSYTVTNVCEFAWVDSILVI